MMIKSYFLNLINGILFHAKEDSKIWRNPFTNESISDNLKKSKLKKDIAIKNGFKIIEME